MFFKRIPWQSAIPVIAGLIEIWLARWRSGVRRVRWSGTMLVPLPPDAACDAIHTALLMFGFRYVRYGAQFDADYYSRGDFRIDRLPCRRDVGWHDVPLILQVIHRPGRQQSFDLAFIARQEVTFTETAAAYFREQAEREFDQLFRQVRANGGSREEEAGCSETDERAVRAAYVALELDMSAPWSQVQAAYREMCHKFHPDRLSGQSIPPHVVELAAERFKQATSAYRTLKERLSP